MGPPPSRVALKKIQTSMAPIQGEFMSSTMGPTYEKSKPLKKCPLSSPLLRGIIYDRLAVSLSHVINLAWAHAKEGYFLWVV